MAEEAGRAAAGGGLAAAWSVLGSSLAPLACAVAQLTCPTVHCVARVQVLRVACTPVSFTFDRGKNGILLRPLKYHGSY